MGEHKCSIEKAIERGWQYLESEHQEGCFFSSISLSRNMFDSQPSPCDVFSTILLLDTILKDELDNETTRRSLQYIEKQKQRGLFTFFEDRKLYPLDTDTNALGYSVLLESGSISEHKANPVLDTILSYQDKDGLVQVWLSRDRPNQKDAVVGANAVYLAHLLGRSSEVAPTEKWLLHHLDSGDYLNGSRYYHSPDSFLYFMNRLTQFPGLAKEMRNKLSTALQERIGKTEYPLDLAMRVSLAGALRVPDELEKQRLLGLQNKDGSWSADALFHYGSKQGYFGSKAITTAFFLKALKKRSK